MRNTKWPSPLISTPVPPRASVVVASTLCHRHPLSTQRRSGPTSWEQRRPCSNHALEVRSPSSTATTRIIRLWESRHHRIHCTDQLPRTLRPPPLSGPNPPPPAT